MFRNMRGFRRLCGGSWLYRPGSGWQQVRPILDIPRELDPTMSEVGRDYFVPGVPVAVNLLHELAKHRSYHFEWYDGIGLTYGSVIHRG